MQLNKILKYVMFILSIIVSVACSTHQNSTNDQNINSGKNDSGKNDSIDSTILNNSTSSQEYAHLPVEKNNTVYFELDKYNITSTYTQMLDQYVVLLSNDPSYKIIIEGHADERGTPEYNIALGERRANAIKFYLQGKGVLSEQISIVSYGKEKPAIIGHTEAAYAKNRRAVIID